MFKIIPYKLAICLTLALLVFAFVFHFLILVQVIPYKITWGGKLKTLEEMYQFESVSIFLNGMFICIVAMKADIFKALVSIRYLNYFLFAMAILFSINTVGNLFAEKSIETFVGTPITCMLAVFCSRIASEKSQNK